MNEKKEIRISFGTAVVLIIAIALIGLMAGVIFYLKMENTNIAKSNEVKQIDKNTVTEVAENNKQAFKYALNGNSLEDFDIRFLQLENTKENKIYSPLSIKYALAMLNEGAEGETKTQISSLIGDYKAKKYINSANMSFANALFIRDTYKNSIKESYINNLKTKYNADVKYDSFTSAQGINSWTREKTLGLIDSIIDDESVNDLSFALVNALGIDMEWQNKFLEPIDFGTEYMHEKHSWESPYELFSNNFKNVKNEISGMGIVASINNYDIVNTLGEDNIRQTIQIEVRKYLEEYPSEAQYYLEVEGYKDLETVANDIVDGYIQTINSNYKKIYKNTDFCFYNDEKVKAFAKDLKEYNGTTLQYIAIMPEEDLDKYINNITAKDINKIIGNLKEIKNQNFKEGVITQILGYIPKFKFDYDLDLIKDLNTMGVKDIFDPNKANLKGMTNEGNTYISEAKHKANMEFTQDGIKAGAVTYGGGRGAGGFEYLYDVPVEEINLTFDKPYLFIIRDKETGEVWFTGTVYEPLSVEDEPMAEEYKTNYGNELTKYSDFLKSAKWDEN